MIYFHTHMHMIPKKLTRFLTYISIGVSTFILDLGLLFLFTETFGLQYLVATAIAFLLAVSLNYFLSRKFAFKGTERSLLHGYIYYMQFAIIGALFITFLMWLLSNYTDFHYVAIRTAIAAVVGIVNYLLNLYVNFKVVGKH